MRVISLCLLLCCMPLAGSAQNASSPDTSGKDGARLSSREDSAKREAIERMLRTLKVDEQYERSIDQILAFVDQTINSDAALSGPEKEEARKAARAGIQASMDALSWERLKPVFVDIYAEVFTIEEIDGLNDFFQTPIGQSFIEKQPQVMEASMRRLGTLMQEQMPKIKEAVEEAIKETQDEETRPAGPGSGPETGTGVTP